MKPFERLYFIRKELGESQENFAKNLGIQRGSYSDVERGRIKTFSESMLLLPRINYGVNPEWVQDGTGEPFLPKTQVKAEIKDCETVQSLLVKLRERDATIQGLNKRIEGLETTIRKMKALLDAE